MFRVQREQIVANPDSGLDPGPPDTHFSLDLPEGRDETHKDLQHLSRDEARLGGQLQAACEQVAPEKDFWFEFHQSVFVLSDECLCLVCGDSCLCPRFPYKAAECLFCEQQT